MSYGLLPFGSLVWLPTFCTESEEEINHLLFEGCRNSRTLVVLGKSEWFDQGHQQVTNEDIQRDGSRTYPRLQG